MSIPVEDSSPVHVGQDYGEENEDCLPELRSLFLDLEAEMIDSMDMDDLHQIDEDEIPMTPVVSPNSSTAKSLPAMSDHVVSDLSGSSGDSADQSAKKSFDGSAPCWRIFKKTTIGNFLRC